MTAWIILLTLAGYFALLLLISWLTGRKADNRSFFTGGRKSSWLMVTVAMIGASISGVTFISVPGAVQAGGYAYLQMVLGFFVGSVLVAPDEPREHLRLPGASLRAGHLPHGSVVLLRVEDVGSVGALLRGVRGAADAGVRSAGRALHGERGADRGAHLALLFPRRRAVAHLDGRAEDGVSGAVRGALHRLHCAQPGIGRDGASRRRSLPPHQPRIFPGQSR